MRPAPAEHSSAGSHWLLRIVGGLLIATALAVSLCRAPDRPAETLVARWAPPPSQFIELDGLLVHLRDQGDPRDPLPMLMLHDVGSSLHGWEVWAMRFARNRRVISIDLPGSGLSGADPAADYRAPTTARFVLSVMDALKLQRVQLIGQGRGGEVALHLASQSPTRIERLLLLNPTGLPWQPMQVPPAFRVAQLPVLHRVSEWLMPRTLVQAQLQSLRGNTTPPPAEQVDRAFELLLRAGNRPALHQQLLAMEQSARQTDGSQEPDWRAVTMPTQILWGQRDRWLPPDLADRLAARIPHADVVRLPEAGHLPQEEDAPGAWAAAQAFLGV